MNRSRLINLLIFIATIIILIVAFHIPGNGALSPVDFNKSLPKPPAEAYQFSLFHTGVFEVAKVFGRSPGCESADAELITETNDAAVKAGLDPRIAASVIATESGCNPYAVSSRGAIGLMQVMVPVWKSKFDFAGEVNLLNPKDNIKVGTKILSDLVYMYGTAEGIRRYNGLGTNCSTCDGSYVHKIMSEGRK